MKQKTVSLIELNIAVFIWAGTAMFAKGLLLPVAHITCGCYLLGPAVLLLYLLVLKLPIKIRHGKDYIVG